MRDLWLFVALGAAGCTPGVAPDGTTSGQGGGAPTSAATMPGATTSTGVCVPQCGQATCGPDGCNGSCGQCKDGYSCNAGGCDPNVWGHTLANPGDRLFEGATSVLVGDRGGVIGRYGLTGGVLGTSQPGAPSGATKYLAEDATAVRAITFGASSPFTGTYWSMDPGTFGTMPVPFAGPDLATMRRGAAVGTEIWSLGDVANGPVLWRFDASSSTALCNGSLQLLLPGTGSMGYGIAAAGDGSVYVGISGTPSSIQHVSCSAGCTCTGTVVTASFPSEFALRGLDLAHGFLYAAGYGTSSQSALVYRVNPANGAILGSCTVDKSTVYDVLRAITTDSDTVFFGGQVGYDTASPMSGTGLVMELPFDFTSCAGQVFVDLPQVSDVRDITVAPGVIHLSGQLPDGNGFVASCLRDGTCPSTF